MVNFRVLVAAFVCASTSAFAPQQAAVVSKPLAASNIKSLEVDDLGNNIAVKNVLNSLQEKGILSQVAQSGLLSKAQAAGVSLSNLEPLLALAAENPDVLVLVEASAPEILPLLPKLVDLAPAALPLLSLAISIPPQVVGALGLASAAAAAGAVVIIPDDTVAQVAAQTLIAGVFGLAVPVVSLGGAAVLSKLTK
mmetsp:Transcript_1576/g.2317  ORF Transcript_1576/g.2317 Transcript_1576/m.2317 type:complete len:195 (-) Transcript_1576:1325-1909(-)|eukprot:CAMPEP_0194202142 /NCGR_PEP_ID=MMETSP0156-20130528/2240_1 /TAXON_ID=33649 /ORGANISM="Thalassionema nitzschioides, Strain L26-B" /LENGTH=194 /DNA_ID=CAMNT_0038927547 /DNA_START=69 /DNA_END=653 /DNA_ORIENTATION=+